MTATRTILARVLTGAALMLFGLGIAVLALELIVRSLGAKPSTYLRKFSSYHNVLGWEKTPNAEGHFVRGDRKILVRMNSRGLRDREYDYDKPALTTRILVLGDSFTEGYDVDIENNFTEILERLLRDSLSGTSERLFEVINAGTGGYSTDQELLFYTTEGFQYKPDIVILMVYAANDIYYNSRSNYGNYTKPLFALSGDTIILTNTPLPRPPTTESVKGIFRDLALYPIVTKAILTNFPDLASMMHRWGLISKSTIEVAAGSDSSAAYPRSFSVYERKADHEIGLSWEITRRIVESLDRKVRKNGAELLLVSIPDKFEIYPDAWLKTSRSYGVDQSKWDPTQPARTLDSICEVTGIRCLDFGSYAREHLTDVPMYNGVHWNEEGNQRVAKFLFHSLRRHGLVR